MGAAPRSPTSQGPKALEVPKSPPQNERPATTPTPGPRSSAPVVPPHLPRVGPLDPAFLMGRNGTNHMRIPWPGQLPQAIAGGFPCTKSVKWGLHMLLQSLLESLESLESLPICITLICKTALHCRAISGANWVPYRVNICQVGGFNAST